MANNTGLPLPPNPPAFHPRKDRAQADHKSKICFKCRRRGHVQNDCKARQCWTCNSWEHLQRDCPEVHATQRTQSIYQSPGPSFQATQGPQARDYPPRQPAFPSQPTYPSVSTRATMPAPAQVSRTSEVFAKCTRCGSMIHSVSNCPEAEYKFKKTYARPVDELPQIPVVLKPTKTAAAIETERQYAEKLAAKKANGSGEVEGKDKAVEDTKEKKGVPGWNDTGDLIEFD